MAENTRARSLRLEDLPCGRWKVGKIHELVKGKDQLVRSPKVLISPDKFLCRALSLLYPIECPEDKKAIQDHTEMDHYQPQLVPIM